MKILVTGGAGFIGSHLVDALIVAGHDVLILDDLSTGSKKYINPKASFEQIEIQDKKVESLFGQFKPDIVYHLAAQKNVRVSLENPLFDAEVNILGGLNILESAKRVGAKKIIFVSSGGAIYDQAQGAADEEAPEMPLSPYGLAKQTIDNFLQYYHTIQGIETLSFRPSNVYGPRQDPKGEAGVIALFFESMLEGNTSKIFGGKQTRDFVYVGDMVDALMTGITKGMGVYIVSTNTEISVDDLYDLQAKVAGSDTQAIHESYVEGEMMRSVLKYDKIKQDLGWEPKVTFEQGLQLTWEWFKNR
ncbi:MAG: NAD-dependent epimerase/dehydratase family protein [Patescibacteria group bacterium]